MKRYVKTNNGVVDTHIRNNPHVECFFIKDNTLYVEEISGRIYPYSEVIALSDDNLEWEEINE